MTEQKLTYGIQELSVALGLSKMTIYKWLRDDPSKLPPSIKGMGRGHRWSRAAVMKWLEKRSEASEQVH